jgi:hypothetical protein
MVFIGDPDAAHQLGLADIQRCDPRDDLLVVLCSGEHPGLLLIGGGRCPQEPGAQLEKSNPRARRHSERPAERLPAPGLETISSVKQQSASADSGHPRFSARNGHPARDIRGLEGPFEASQDVAWYRPASHLAASIVADCRRMSHGVCLRWLPNWLPEIHLPSLTFE